MTVTAYLAERLGKSGYGKVDRKYFEPFYGIRIGHPKEQQYAEDLQEAIAKILLCNTPPRVRLYLWTWGVRGFSCVQVYDSRGECPKGGEACDGTV